MKGVILAAGKGTRMLPLTERRPKPLVPLLEAPMLEHILQGMRQAGVRHVALVIGHLGHMIQEYFGNGATLGLNLEYIWQKHPEGTGAATLLAEEFVGKEPFMLSWGDIMVAPETYSNILRVWKEEQPDAVLSLNVVEDPWEGAAVYVDESGFVQKIIEKPPRGTSRTNFNNAGIFVFPPELFDILRSVPPSARGEIEVPDAIQTMLSNGARVRGVPVIGYWSDVARPAAVLELNSVIIRYRCPEKAIIISEDAQIASQALLRPPVYIGAGCRIEKAEIGPNVALGAETIVGSGVKLENVATFGHNHFQGRCVLRYAVIEDKVKFVGEQYEGSRDTPLVILKP